jgi:hypothetical protein
MKIRLLFFFCCIFQLGFAQQWYSVDSGIHGKYEGLNVVASAAIVDTVHNLLFVVGTFDSAGNVRSRNFAYWDGVRWRTTETIDTYHIPLKSIVLYHDTVLISASSQGLGTWYDTTDIFKGGDITNGIGNVTCFTYYHDTLWAGGSFGVKYYNGTKWVKPPGIFSTLNAYVEINAMTVYNNELIIGGYFNGIGDTVCHNIAAWDGKVWHSLGKGTRASFSPYVGNVYSLGVYKNELYAGGWFDSAGDISCSTLGRWNGNNWDQVGGNNLCGIPYTMLNIDSGLYIGGDLYGYNIGYGNCASNQVVKWDGNKFHDFNFKSSGAGVVYSLAWFDGQLYAVGSFGQLNGNFSIKSIARSIIATGIPSTTK